MDDLFFTDKHNNNNRRDRDNRAASDYSGIDFDGEHDDIFSDSAFGRDEKSGFKVTLPDDEYKSEIYTPRNNARTPKGRPVGQAPAQTDEYPVRSQSSRTPQGRPVSQAGTADVSGSRRSGSKDDVYSQSNAQYTPPNRSAAGRPNLRNSDMPKQTPKAPVRSQGGRPSGSTPKGSAKKKKGGSRGKKIAVAVFAVIALLFVCIFAYGYSILGKINYDADFIEKNQYISESELASSSSVRNILIIGSDARSEIQGQRSDTMILFSIDNKNKKIKLTSFLRDSYVCIPSSGNYRKLNAACSSGGAQLVIDTIEYNFKVKIDDYVLVDFEAFEKLIDLMGGLTVKDVTAAEAKYLREKVQIVYAKEGTNKFSGAAALWYCRIRYLDDDFHRTQRQRKVISAVISQAKSMSPAQLIKIVEQVLPMITTDISRNEMLKLGVGAAVKYMRYDIEQHQVPADKTWSNAKVYGVGDVLKMDIDQNAKLLEQFLYSDSEE